MRKRVLSMILVVAMICAFLPQLALSANAAETSGTCGDNLTWNFNDTTGILTIIGSGMMFNYNSGSISLFPPWYDLGNQITGISLPQGLTSIGSYAFYCVRNSRISVTIPNSVTSIGDHAFYECNSLTSVTIPDSVTNIGSGAFESCHNLTSVMIPATLKSINFGTFLDCISLTSVTIPTSVTAIESQAFRNCTSLTNVIIPGSVISIGDSVFENCSSISSVRVPDSVTSIGDKAFYGCSSLMEIDVSSNNPNYISTNGVLFQKEKEGQILIQCPGGKSGVYDLPDGVIGIGDSAFESCSSLTSVTILDGVISIGDSAFKSCSSLISVTIPDSVTSISFSAFENCSSLTSVTIPDGVKSIYNRLFFGCTSLMSVTIPASVKAIGFEAFSGCTSLANVAIPANVTSISNYAFFNCTSLLSATIPDGVKNIGRYAFTSCTSLMEIDVAPGNPNYSSVSGVLFTKDQTMLIQCPGGKTGFYSIPSSVTYIYDFSFQDCDSITEVTISSGMTEITDQSFSNCDNLSSVTIPGSVRSIGKEAFKNCVSLSNVTIPNSVTSIGDYAFENCSTLTSVTIPSSVTKIGARAFGFHYNQESSEREKVDGFTIYGYPNTAAETYAKENRFQFIALQPMLFSDVPSNSYVFDPVNWAVENGITNGTSPTTFSPNATCTRGQVVTFLWRAENEPEPETSQSPFVDVQMDRKAPPYYYNAVLWAVENKITTGTSPNTFSPNAGCTRGQVVTFLWRAAGQPEPAGKTNPFTDVKSDAYYYKAVLWAVEKGITKGTSTDKFSPESTCTRGQIVTFLYRDMAG